MSAPRAPFGAAVRALSDAFQELGLPWLVIGGIAIIVRGVPRSTLDLDVTVWAAGRAPESLLGVLGRHGIVPRIQHAAAFARERQVLLLRHEASGVPIDVSLALLPFEEQAIREGESYEFAGVSIPVARAEDLLIYKLVAARPRDIDDAEKLLLLSGRRLDLDRVRRVVREFAVALEDHGRLDTLERLLKRTDLAP